MSATEASQQANRPGMNRQRLLVTSFLVLGFILALFLGRMADIALTALGIRNVQVVEGLTELNVANFVGFGTALAIGIWAWTHPRVAALSNEVAEELLRVTWPSWNETRTSTIAVAIASLIAAVVLFGMDTFSYKLMVDWLPIVWGKL